MDLASLKNFNYDRKPTTIYENRNKNKGFSGDKRTDRKTAQVLYKKENLNTKQRELFDHVVTHTNDIVLLQAGPGELMHA